MKQVPFFLSVNLLLFSTIFFKYVLGVCVHTCVHMCVYKRGSSIFSFLHLFIFLSILIDAACLLHVISSSSALVV